MVLIHSAVLKGGSKIFHTLSALAAACNYFFAFLRRFLQYVTFLTEPDHITYSNLDFHYQMMDKFSSIGVGKISPPFLVYFGDNISRTRRLSIDKIPTRAPLPSTIYL